MTATRRVRGLLAVVAACLASPAAAEPLRIMSVNVRYGTADDGENGWPHRRELLAETIAAFDPDLLGTQELLAPQREFLMARLGGSASFGRSRRATPDEQCAVFYRASRFTRLAGGHFWLSPTPENPASKGWDAALPRIATWVLLADATEPRPVLMVNTHFDHRGAEARVRSARLLRTRVAALAAIAERPRVVVVGDFNAGSGSATHRELTGSKRPGGVALRDTFAVINRPGPQDGTLGRFVGQRTGPRIDWILIGPTLRCTRAGIDRTSVDGRYPSDHFPVFAVVESRD